ncbi:translation initiation factor eIF-2B subunit beta [Entomortierella parvispora]|uniref:Translation initiation factor eIF2B subunit beta n=1 Tax=Entomortierella parvispora TaxID=205924 RepID=A0A9P3H8M1_9FUNG|nr:translation initiation factor eIF-2B subunit beta [Entomortierella parvispora]
MSMSKNSEHLVDDLVAKLKRRQLVGSSAVAQATLKLLIVVISKNNWTTSKQLLTLVKSVGQRLNLANPTELAVGNIIRRVLHIIREEFREAAGHVDSPKDGSSHQGGGHPHEGTNGLSEFAPLTTSSSMYNLLGETGSSSDDDVQYPSSLRSNIIQEIREVKDELENIYDNIKNQASLHIHSNEIIMTIGRSKTVEEFLKMAAMKRKFQVLVAESAPSYSGQEMAVELSKAGIETTVIPDSAVFAVMSRVNKVILGTHAVLANGGLVAISGTHMMAAAAKHHSIPVVVCTGLYKLSPLYPYDEDSFNVTFNPDSVLGFEEGDLIEKVTVTNPYYDYVSPELVNLFLTNQGGHPPSYLYRLIVENYDPNDRTFDL